MENLLIYKKHKKKINRYIKTDGKREYLCIEDIILDCTRIITNR